MNPWHRFQRLLSVDSPTVVLTKVIHDDGTTTVETQSGNQFRVNGQASDAGVWVVIEGGRIVRDLGGLGFLDLDV